MSFMDASADDRIDAAISRIREMENLARLAREESQAASSRETKRIARMMLRVTISAGVLLLALSYWVGGISAFPGAGMLLAALVAYIRNRDWMNSTSLPSAAPCIPSPSGRI